MTSLRFSKIGTIVRAENGEYDIGPLPDIGGPFDTATQFFEAWAERSQFPHGKDQVIRRMGSGPAQRVQAARLPQRHARPLWLKPRLRTRRAAAGREPKATATTIIICQVVGK
jgi:hypothetical protein